MKLAALSVGIYGSTQLETDFNFVNWVNEGSYVREYLEVQQSHFSSASGVGGSVYIGGEGLEFSSNMDKVMSVIQVNSHFMPMKIYFEPKDSFRHSKLRQGLMGP